MGEQAHPGPTDFGAVWAGVEVRRVGLGGMFLALYFLGLDVVLVPLILSSSRTLSHQHFI